MYSPVWFARVGSEVTWGLIQGLDDRQGPALFA